MIAAGKQYLNTPQSFSLGILHSRRQLGQVLMKKRMVMIMLMLTTYFPLLAMSHSFCSIARQRSSLLFLNNGRPEDLDLSQHVEPLPVTLSQGMHTNMLGVPHIVQLHCDCDL